MNNWKCLLLLPNLRIEEEIGNNYIKVVNFKHELAQSLIKKTENLNRFVSSFCNQFGVKIYPSLLLYNFVKPAKPSIEAIVSFRNILAIAAITDAWQRLISFESQFDYYRFSDYFEFFPYSLSTDSKNLVANTPAILAIDSIEKFSGQNNPKLANPSFDRSLFDRLLFDPLLSKWTKYFLQKKKIRDWTNISLFRSLEMAFRASSLPFGNNASIHDYGANISLWVSAFEILVHEKDKFVGVKDVLQKFGEIDFLSNKLNYKRHRATYRGEKLSLTLVQKNYFSLFQVRNAFLHGNKVLTGNLFPNQNRKTHSYLAVAPLLYKALLIHLLGTNKFGSLNNDIEIDRYVDNSEFESSLIKINAIIRFGG